MRIKLPEKSRIAVDPLNHWVRLKKKINLKISATAPVMIKRLLKFIKKKWTSRILNVKLKIAFGDQWNFALKMSCHSNGENYRRWISEWIWMSWNEPEMRIERSAAAGFRSRVVAGEPFETTKQNYQVTTGSNDFFKLKSSSWPNFGQREVVLNSGI